MPTAVTDPTERIPSLDPGSDGGARPGSEPGAVCRNCGHPIADHYCSHCGQRRLQGRLTVRSAAQELLGQLLGWESGFFHTVLELWRRPGNVIRGYIAGHRRPYTGPFKYLAIWIAAFAILFALVDFDDYAPPERVLDTSEIAALGLPSELPTWVHDFDRQVRRYSNLVYLITLPMVAGVTRVVFRRSGFNYAEHVVFNAYVAAQSSMLLLVFVLVSLSWLSARTYFLWVVSQLALGLVYFTWAAVGCFRTSVIGAVWRSLCVLVANFVLVQIVLIAGFVIYFLFRIAG